MDYLDWAVRIGVAGLVWWVLRAYLAERTKKVKASEQYLTVGEIKDNCKEQKEEILREVETEMKHLSETIKADLDRGQERFKELGDIQKETTKALTNLTTEIRLLQQARNNKNATQPQPAPA